MLFIIAQPVFLVGIYVCKYFMRVSVFLLPLVCFNQSIVVLALNSAVVDEHHITFSGIDTLPTLTVRLLTASATKISRRTFIYVYHVRPRLQAAKPATLYLEIVVLYPLLRVPPPHLIDIVTLWGEAPRSTNALSAWVSTYAHLSSS